MAKKEKVIKRKYTDLVGDISQLLETARKESARTVNALLTATYWLIGYRIVEFEYRIEIGRNIMATLCCKPYRKNFKKDTEEVFPDQI